MRSDGDCSSSLIISAIILFRDNEYIPHLAIHAVLMWDSFSISSSERIHLGCTIYEIYKIDACKNGHLYLCGQPITAARQHTGPIKGSRHAIVLNNNTSLSTAKIRQVLIPNEDIIPTAIDYQKRK